MWQLPVRSAMILIALRVIFWPSGNTAAQDMPLSDVLIPGAGWQLVAEGYTFTEGPAADREGNVFFSDIPASRIYRIDGTSGDVTLFAENTARTNGLMFGPQGRLFGCRNGDQQIVAYSVNGTYEVIAERVPSNDLVVTSSNTLYITDPPNQRVWYIDQERASSPRTCVPTASSCGRTRGRWS
jgi:gluconolactonase